MSAPDADPAKEQAANTPAEAGIFAITGPVDARTCFDALARLSRQWPFLADGEGSLLSIDAGWAAFTGTSVETAHEQDPLAALHPEDRLPTQQAWAHAIETGKEFEREFRVTYHDGTFRWVRVRAARVPDTGTEARWFGTIEDIDGQRRLHEQAVAAEQRYRLASRATGDLIWDHDISTGELRLGEAISSVFGYVLPSELVDISWWVSIIHPEDREATERSYAAAYEGSQDDWLGEYRLRRADGEYLLVRDCAFIVRDEFGRCVRAVGAARDLTAQMEAEQRLGELQAELIHVSRASAMGAMGVMLAHELNQPLTAVTAYIRGVQRLLADGSAAAITRSMEAMNEAAECALSAGAIVRRLRQLVSDGESMVSVHDLPELIHDACALALLDARRWNIDVQLMLDPGARFVAIDKVQIQQVLVNLLRNAVEAMRGTPQRTLTICTARAGECAEIGIGDTGPGIPADQRASLFEPFSSGKPGGMGVGLSICRTIMAANGGRIWLDRSDEKGTVFCFSLPLAEEPS